MAFVVEDPDRHAGQVVANGHCVRFAQEAARRLPHTSQWRRGARVRYGNVPPGTVIATFESNGCYGNHIDGRSHAAILVAEEAGGLRVWDQWVGHPVQQRLIRFRDGAGKPVNDGDAFHVVETEESLA
jgi:hypothetical protein